MKRATQRSASWSAGYRAAVRDAAVTLAHHADAAAIMQDWPKVRVTEDLIEVVKQMRPKAAGASHG